MKRNGKGVEGEATEGDSSSRGNDATAAAAGETTSGRGSCSGGSGSDDPETVYRAMLRRSALQMLAGSGSLTGNLGLRFGGSSSQSAPSLPNGRAAAAAAAAAAGGRGGSSRQGPDSVQRLSMDECWKLILELGTRWPAWNEATALQATVAARKEKNEVVVASTNGGQHLHTNDERDNRQQPPQQEFLKQLANRALDALAAQPPSRPRHRPRHHGELVTGGMQAPKQPTQGRLDSRVAAPEAPTIPTPPFQKPSRATISSRDMPAPKASMTRPPSRQELTIFYDGIVNVCDNVPPDKARLIMMFAGKAGLTPTQQKPPQFKPPAPQPSPAPCQPTPHAHATPAAAVAGPSSPIDLNEECKPISPTKVPLLAGPSSSVVCEPTPPAGPSPSVACEPVRPTLPIVHEPARPTPPVACNPMMPVPARPPAVAVEGPSSQVKAPVVNEALECTKQALAQGKASMPIKITTGTQPSKPRQVRPNVMLKPLPNARRNSLARFLDSRKRQSTCEEVPPKKPALGEGSQCSAEDSKGIGKPFFSQSSKELKEEGSLAGNKNVVDQAPSSTS